MLMRKKMFMKNINMLYSAPMELQMVFTISASADPVKYWQILARVQNRLFQFREKLVIVIAVLVDVLVSIFKLPILHYMSTITQLDIVYFC